jgi:hypothetical protein
MARAGGAQVLGAAEAQVFERLSPVFRVGGVVVGSHAFAVIGSSLGVRWQDAIARTEDVDIAHAYRIAVALAHDGPPADIRQALGDPLPRFSVLSPTHPATAFRVRGTEIDVEILTPMVGKERSKPIKMPVLGIAATLCASSTTSSKTLSLEPFSADPVSWSTSLDLVALPSTSWSSPPAAGRARPLTARRPRIARRQARCCAY